MIAFVILLVVLVTGAPALVRWAAWGMRNWE